MAAEPKYRVVFQCPSELWEAIQTAAAEDMCSISDVARQAVLKEMREREFIAIRITK